jgi:SAM-dependent methyltransferase
LAFDLQYLKDELPKPKGIKVLELGSVPPILTHAIQNEGYNITGYDINPHRFKDCIRENKIYIKKGEVGNNTLPFRDAQFDAIIMNEIFEHFNTNLIEVFKDINRILKVKGELFISTPNLKSLVGIRNFLLRGKAYSCCGEIYEEYEKIEKYGHMGHIREYTTTEISLFLKNMGLKPNTLIYRGNYPARYRIIEKLMPCLKPYFSIISTKEINCD